MKFKSIVSTVAATFTMSLACVLPAHADTVTANFTRVSVIGMDGPDPSSIASFTLNLDGTIAAKATATSSSGIYQFLYNTSQYYASTNLTSGAVSHCNGCTTATPWGMFNSGWEVNGSGSHEVTWTIGTPGSFTSAAQIFSPNGQGFVLLAGTRMAPADTPNGNVFTAWAASTVTPVPEPDTYAMILAGLGLIGVVGRRRITKPIDAGLPVS